MKQAVKKGIVVGLGVILQFALTLLLYLFLIEKIWIVDVIYALLSVIIVVGLIRNSKNYSYTLPWIIIVLLFPLVGTLLFIAIGQNRQSSKILKSIVESEKSSKKYLKQDENLRKEISANSRLRYIIKFSG